MKSKLPVYCGIFLALTTPATAGNLVDMDGLIDAPLEIHNSGSTSILCQAEIAHWFATDLATIAPGDRVSLGLRFQPRDGTWAVMNARNEALPVERAWCGVKGRTYETRWSLTLDRSQPKPQQLDCRVEDAGLTCR